MAGLYAGWEIVCRPPAQPLSGSIINVKVKYKGSSLLVMPNLHKA